MNQQATPTDNEWTPRGHFYSPIPFYAGRVLKYQGIACDRNMQHMLAEPGMVMLSEYKGDRITADTHSLFTGV